AGNSLAAPCWPAKIRATRPPQQGRPVAMRGKVPPAAALVLLALAAAPAPAQKERPPHGQDTVPGPALSPREAIRKMRVPPGFAVELVAAEPDIVNPVAMTFDERGRIWVTESLEYPRQSAGPGRDRIKILESTK